MSITGGLMCQILHLVSILKQQYILLTHWSEHMTAIENIWSICYPRKFYFVHMIHTWSHGVKRSSTFYTTI
ncbi:unnamed protein product [Calypogeia fissa]